MTRALSELVLDRFRKNGLYNAPAYWNMKASGYAGLARSNWPSNSYNAHIHATQMELIDRQLGDVRDQAVADVGCGTGRVAQHLARRGARVHGFDFSAAAIDAARRETADLGLQAEFSVRDVQMPPVPENRSRFDVVLSLACLTVACRDESEVMRALHTMTTLCKPGGRVLFLEPLHRSWLLRRIMPLSASDFARLADREGLSLCGRGGIQFVPARYALAFRDLPEPLVAALYRSGEALLSSYPALEPLSDYKWLLFRRR